jgi:hypothetical protein
MNIERNRIPTLISMVVSLIILGIFIVLSNLIAKKSKNKIQETKCEELRRMAMMRMIESANKAGNEGDESAKKGTGVITAGLHYQHAMSVISCCQALSLGDSPSGINLVQLHQHYKSKRDNVLQRIARMSGGKFKVKQ